LSHDESPVAASGWPPEDLEPVANCPFCAVSERSLAFADMEDWIFRCAPGKWNSWKCKGCGALYLDPRPTEASIGRAYARYFTHDRAAGGTLIEQVKTLLRHTCYLAWHDLDLKPRLPLPRFMQPLLAPLRRRMADPFFILQILNRLPRGRLMDVGCGNGGYLAAARQLGWTVQGLEIDPQAVAAARAAGLDVLQGDYRCLDKFQGAFDCLVCSHVIEHVHAPLALLQAIHAALKPDGVALISLPNADSIVLEAFGANWRGLEAPRHLAIPTARTMRALFEAQGFAVEAAPVSSLATLEATLAIARRRGLDLRSTAERLRRTVGIVDETRSDFINLVLRKVAE